MFPYFSLEFKEEREGSAIPVNKIFEQVLVLF